MSPSVSGTVNAIAAAVAVTARTSFSNFVFIAMSCFSPPRYFLDGFLPEKSRFSLWRSRHAYEQDKIQELRNQQKVILKVLEVENFEASTRVITKKTWVALLRAAGLDDAGMKNWHIEFEKTSPEGHQDFLESIGIEEIEVAEIREWSKIS